MLFQAPIEGYGRSKSYIKFPSNEPYSLTHVVYYFSGDDLPEPSRQIRYVCCDLRVLPFVDLKVEEHNDSSEVD